MLPGPVSIPPPLPEMARHASDALWLNVMMAEVQALGTGRKIRIDIWTVFNYKGSRVYMLCQLVQLASHFRLKPPVWLGK